MDRRTRNAPHEAGRFPNVAEANAQLVAARQKATDSRGGNGFLTVSATHAALLLAQGAGRLLRGMDDRGVVAILDPRLATARYGGFLRASLPPFWPTDDREKVHAALRRLRGA